MAKPLKGARRSASFLLRVVVLSAVAFFAATLLYGQQPGARKTPPRKAPAATAATAAPAAQPKYKGIWEPVSYPEDLQLLDVFFVNADVGWVAGGANTVRGGIILSTRDGGDSWTVQYGDPESSEGGVKDLRFIDETTGWAVQHTSTDVKLLHTRDGENWILAGTMGAHYVDYMFTSETTGVYLGSQGAVFVTEDGGRKWEEVFQCAAKVQVEGLWRNVACHWKRLQFLTPTTGYAVAMSYDAKGIFLARTDDGGATWSLTYSEIAGTPEDVFFLDESTGYVGVGHPSTGQLYKTEDGGQTWTGMAASPGNRILFADPEVGWAILYNKVSFTTNAGLRWNSREYRFPATTSAFSLPRRDRGYVVGEHGMIYRYRMVPEDYTARGMMPAPLLSGIDSPLDEQVEQLDGQVDALQEAFSEAAPPGEEGAEVTAEFTEQIDQAEETLEAMETTVPQFVGKYKNMNLLLAGFQMANELPAQIQGLKESFQALKQIKKDPQSAAAAVTEMQTKVQGLVGMVRGFFQKR